MRIIRSRELTTRGGAASCDHGAYGTARPDAHTNKVTLTRRNEVAWQNEKEKRSMLGRGSRQDQTVCRGTEMGRGKAEWGVEGEEIAALTAMPIRCAGATQVDAYCAAGGAGQLREAECGGGGRTV